MKPPDNPNTLTRYERRERAAADVLRGLVRDFLVDHFPGAANLEEDLLLNLVLRVNPREDGQLRFDPDLRSQLILQMENLLKPAEAFQPGAVFDFYEDSSDTVNSRPPDAVSVFAGYDPFGHPVWTPFETIAPGNAKESESVRVLIQTGKELKSRQLAEYGKSSHDYSILGQLCLGYLPLPAAYQPIANSPRLALTLQVVECRNSRGGFELNLNILCGGLLTEEFETLLQEPGFHTFASELRNAEKMLFRLSEKAKQAWKHQDTHTLNQQLKRVPSFLGRTANQLQKSL